MIASFDAVVVMPMAQAVRMQRPGVDMHLRAPVATASGAGSQLAPEVGVRAQQCCGRASRCSPSKSDCKLHPLENQVGWRPLGLLRNNRCMHSLCHFCLLCLPQRTFSWWTVCTFHINVVRCIAPCLSVRTSLQTWSSASQSYSIWAISAWAISCLDPRGTLRCGL